LTLAYNQFVNYTLSRIGSQMNSQGVLINEVQRAIPWHYSIFNLEAFFTAARLAEHVGVDLWNYTTSDGKSIRKALDYLLTFVDNPDAWTHGPVSEVDLNRLNVMLLPLAYEHYGDLKYLEAFQAIQGDARDRSVNRLLYHISIPEPSSLLLLAAGGAVMMRRRR